MRNLFVTSDLRPFAPIDPPFNFNAANVAAHAPEVTGYYLLQALAKRLNWPSFVDRRVLDLGCGVRFARTIFNLDIPFGLYVGVDVNAAAIEWLATNISDPRFRFYHLNARNALYNPGGSFLGADALSRLDLGPIDVVTMYSVITHQRPAEALETFKQAREVASPSTVLYFTAFLDESASDFCEAEPDNPGGKCIYPPAEIVGLAEQAGWRMRSIHTQSQTLQQPAFICEVR